MSSVGTVTSSENAATDSLCKRSAAPLGRDPVTSAAVSAVHTKLSKFGQPNARLGSSPKCCNPVMMPSAVKPTAQMSLGAPLATVEFSSAGTTELGASEYSKSFHVMSGTKV